MKKPTVSIIIPTFNHIDLTLKCLDSIKKQTYPKNSIEIIVVDNYSQDKTPIIIRQKFPKVKIFAQKSNLKFAKAINLGAKAAHGQLLFITNNDVTFEPDFFEKLINFAIADPQIGICGGLISHKGEHNFESPANMSRLTSQILPLKNYHKIQEVDWITGAGLLVKKRIFDLINGFDPNLPFYFEDADFCFRVKNLGLKVIYYPQTKMHHSPGSTASQMNKKDLYLLWYQGKIRFIEKHFNYWSKPLALSAQFIFCLLLLITKRQNRLSSFIAALNKGQVKKNQKISKRSEITENQILAYYKKGEVFTARGSSRFQQVILKDFYKLLNKEKSTKQWGLLEFGVGHGWNLPTMSSFFGKITAVDIAPAAILESKEYKLKNIRYLVLKNKQLPFKNNTFDMVVATEVLEHVPELAKTVEELKRVTKKNGFLLISVPTYLNLRGISKKVMEVLMGTGTWEPAHSHPGGFERFLTPGKIKNQFKNTTIVRTQGADYGTAWSFPSIPFYPQAWAPFFEVTIGKLPIIKNFGMNFYLLVQKNE